MLGKGAYGCVLGCVERDTKQRFACKSVSIKALLKTRDGPNIVGRLKNEVAVMAHLNGHPNIVKLVDVFESADRLFIVQELCTGGTVRHSSLAPPPTHTPPPTPEARCSYCPPPHTYTASHA